MKVFIVSYYYYNECREEIFTEKELETLKTKSSSNSNIRITNIFKILEV